MFASIGYDGIVVLYALYLVDVSWMSVNKDSYRCLAVFYMVTGGGVSIWWFSDVINVVTKSSVVMLFAVYFMFIDR